jgi:DNA replication licensing factor MCM5
MASFDQGAIYYSDHTLVPRQGELGEDSGLWQDRFQRFVREFRSGNAFIYRDQLKHNYNLKRYCLDIQLEHLAAFDDVLADKLLQMPNQFIPHCEAAAAKAAALLYRTSATAAAAAASVAMTTSNAAAASTTAATTVPLGDDPSLMDPSGAGIAGHLQPIQLLVSSALNPVPLRELTSAHISTLVRVPGIVISASRLQAKAIKLTIICRMCLNRKVLFAKSGFGQTELPARCDANAGGIGGSSADQCPPNSFVILPDECEYIDQQVLKLQEAPETIPTGEMPRHMLATVDRVLTGVVAPGTRVTLVGIYTVFSSQERGASEAVRHPYLRVLGVHRDTQGVGRALFRFAPREVQAFTRFAKRRDAYEIIARSIAPSLFGHNDCKRAIACLLFGGTRKALPDGTRLRGDINVLMLGDPGTGKSQLLKFVERVAPIGVYTSGKGSSAAGLTASVVRDKSTREFYLEGGAMVMADGGVVCIDEFDKMHLRDRVAIHEAMEQQTISIAKAGITTILNSRTSVLAAANPIHGRYDTFKSAEDNIDFQATILSRFDMIFVIKDVRNKARDTRMAQHVLDLHTSTTTTRHTTANGDGDLLAGDDDGDAGDAMGGDAGDDGGGDQYDELVGENGEIPIEKLKRYIAYARTKCAPRLSDEAAETLQNHYVAIRSTVREREVAGGRAVIPITVRQLEAIVRISESLAKMLLLPVAHKRHVDEAIRLFKVSTLEAATSAGGASEVMTPELAAEVEVVEQRLRQRLPVGHSSSERAIMDDFVRQGLSSMAVGRAIAIMMQREELEYKNRRKMLYRKR